MKARISELENTEYGFIWGPATIERLFDFGHWPKSKYKGVVVSIRGEKGSVDIRVTPTGYVRIENQNGRHQ